MALHGLEQVWQTVQRTKEEKEKESKKIKSEFQKSELRVGKYIQKKKNVWKSDTFVYLLIVD